jgi:hypothetical protein
MAFDALAQVVRVGDRVWPVVLDCSRNTAWVDLGGRRWELRALGWGQKRSLARFTAPGARFLRRQLAIACTGQPDVPADPDEAEALAAVGAWLSAPTSGELPLEPVTLADVTAEWVRRTGRPAAEVDGQPAADVEAWWESCAEGREERVAPAAPEPAAGPRDRSAAPPGPGGGLRRILVIPEPAGSGRDTGPGLDAAGPGGGLRTPSVPPAEPSAGDERADISTAIAAAGSDRDGIADTAASRPAAGDDRAPAPPARPSVTAARPATANRRGPSGRPVAPIFRLLYPAAAPPAPMTPGPDHAPAGDDDAPWPAGGRRTRSAEDTAAAAGPAPPVASPRPAAPAGPPAARLDRAPGPAPRDATEAMLDALADRLAEAASAAGIDVSA